MNYLEIFMHIIIKGIIIAYTYRLVSTNDKKTKYYLIDGSSVENLFSKYFCYYFLYNLSYITVYSKPTNIALSP